ncbi:hypothetical protein RIF29_25110 [Crotalaria pallida]|uniref:Uncharacterized protein n=1 Tax=Crotalaria pallida TaxID=3830 RepID=A0AAN9EKY5_CROPI
MHIDFTAILSTLLGRTDLGIFIFFIPILKSLTHILFSWFICRLRCSLLVLKDGDLLWCCWIHGGSQSLKGM